MPAGIELVTDGDDHELMSAVLYDPVLDILSSVKANAQAIEGHINFSSELKKVSPIPSDHQDATTPPKANPAVKPPTAVLMVSLLDAVDGDEGDVGCRCGLSRKRSIASSAPAWTWLERL